MQWLRGWEWSIILAVLLATGIAVWLAIYPGLPDGVKTPIVADITVVAGKATQVADIAGGGLIPYLFLVIQLIRSEVKEVIFVRNVEKRAAEVAEREEAVKQREAAVTARETAAVERAAVVAARETAVVEQATAAAKQAAGAAEQTAAAVAEQREQMAAILKWAEEQGFNLPPGLAANGHSGNGEE